MGHVCRDSACGGTGRVMGVSVAIANNTLPGAKYRFFFYAENHQDIK